jgi:putative Ca2+/H+ antiporter (TMEM165/GDT1 family)
MNPAAAATSFLIILPAELPDKTVLACLVMGSRYRPVFVFAGAGAAFTAHVALAVTAGGLLGGQVRRSARRRDRSVLALWVAAGGAIIGGRSLLKVMPMTWLTRGAALVMLVLAGASIVTALS